MTKTSEFKKAEASLKAAQKRMDALLIERAKALYPHYDDMVPSDDYPGFEGGCVTQESARKDALESLRKHETHEEALAAREAGRTVLRTVYVPVALDDRLRVRAFREGVEKGSLIVEALQVWFDALGPETEAKRAPVKPRRIVGKPVK